MSNPESHQPLPWHAEHSIETVASPAAVWKLWADVAAWKRWNAGVESIVIEGPFVAGTWFVMTVPGQEPMRSQLIAVRENEEFVDETIVGEVTVRVAHRVVASGPGRARVSYATEVVGPGAAEVGPMVSGDFPEVLQALVSLAEAGNPGSVRR